MELIKERKAAGERGGQKHCNSRVVESVSGEHEVARRDEPGESRASKAKNQGKKSA